MLPLMLRAQLIASPWLSVCAVQVPDRNFFLIANSETDRNEWVAAIGELRRWGIGGLVR